METYAGKFGQLYDALHAAGRNMQPSTASKVMDVDPAPPNLDKRVYFLQIGVRLGTSDRVLIGIDRELQKAYGITL